MTCTVTAEVVEEEDDVEGAGAARVELEEVSEMAEGAPALVERVEENAGEETGGEAESGWRALNLVQTLSWTCLILVIFGLFPGRRERESACVCV